MQGVFRPQEQSIQPDVVETAPEVLKQPSEAVRAMEILSQYTQLDTPEEANEHTGVAVSFGDDKPDPEPTAQRQQAQQQPQRSRLDYNSSSEEEDAREHSRGDAVDATEHTAPSGVMQISEAPLVALSTEQRTRKHILDVDDGADALGIEEGEDKLNLHQIAAGVDVLGGFDGHMDPPGSLHHASDRLAGDGDNSVDGDSGNDSDVEAEMLRTLLQDKSASDGAVESTGSSLLDAEQEESGSEQELVQQMASEHDHVAVVGRHVSEGPGESESDEESSGEEKEDGDGQIVGGEIEPGEGMRSGTDDSIAQDEIASLEQSEEDSPGGNDVWGAAFRLAAGGAKTPGSDADMSKGEDDVNDALEDAAVADTEVAAEGDIQRGKGTVELEWGRQQQDRMLDQETEVPFAQNGMSTKRVAMMSRSNRAGLQAAHGGVQDGNAADSSGELDRDEGAAEEDQDEMDSDDLKAQMQELEREVMLQQKAAKSTSKRKRSNAERDARREQRMAAASKPEGEDDGKQPGPSKYVPTTE